MPKLGLDGHLLHALIEDRMPEGNSSLDERWPAYDRPGERRCNPPDRSTLYRWIGGSMPRTSDQLLRLCGILDVDPMCLLKLPDGDPDAALDSLATSYLHGQWKPPAIKFLNEFLGRRAQWPPPDLAQRYFGRKWCHREFAHEATARTNCYATISIAATQRMPGDGPFVYHVAFRHPALFVKRWLQYGVVLRHGNRVSLRHINGHTDMCDVEDVRSPLRIETWFGPNPAVFRVASLHPFQLEVEESPDEKVPVVRFVG